MQIKIQGTIVSADYDDELFDAWIKRGIITPSSRIVTALESATDPVDVYINSYGGDVFAGGEMLIALMKCKARNCIGSIEVGSIAASMSANIIAVMKAQGVKVLAHSNSQLMFHGCYTKTEGGAQHHEDVASSLRNINDVVINSLNHLGIENCRAWFAEGREKWLGANEAKELNLFDEIVDACAPGLAEVKQTASRLAAFAASLTNRKDYSMKVDEIVVAEEEKPVETPAAAPAEPTPEPAPAPETAPASEPTTPAAPETAPVEEPPADPAPTAQVEIDAKADALANERFAKLQAKHDQMISELKAKNSTLEAELAKATADATTLTEKVAKLDADLADARNQLTAEKKAHESVVAGALKPVTNANLTNRERIASGMKLV